jgi:hypothetical protein
MSLQFAIAFARSIFYLTPPAWADSQAGMYAYESGDYVTR